jgi:uncharacterized membrane protein YccC
MSTDRPDPGEFLEMAQRMLRELFGSSRDEDDDDPWGEATRRERESFSRERHRGPSAERQRENLTFALATRAVEALEDLALNVAAIRQRLERTAPTAPTASEAPPGGTGQQPPVDPGPVA